MLTDPRKIDQVAEQSQQIEEDIFLSHIGEFYDQKMSIAMDLYDAAAEHTNNFRDIEKEDIREDPRIVRILRYLVKPKISQMKFGQFAGVNSTNNYEEYTLAEASTPNHQIAQDLADFTAANLDPEKVPWLSDPTIDEEEEIEYSRRWICDKIAEQEATTHYRNWRKDKQEQTVAETLDDAGYTDSGYSGKISSTNDIPVGTYAEESKVAGADVQKADFIVRPTEDTVIFIEAKAIGVRVDSHKRVKEIRNKASDWKNEFEGAETVAVIEGWTTGDKVRTMMDDDIAVYWEHRLEEDFHEDLAEKLNQSQQKVQNQS
ncbi:XamI family restriction endonuclease [Halogeometricum borinquense]|uniref:XamI family restriction endonuclease n=1 Tax=Halogeometricum borinquense TaxID=60847 RepID=A0A6C0UJ68_9EURY|nr:XamI family restriction endonuclease [Halogeometricum borinquense]QIB75240.1 XamI family restriction endonuclease [Halogeometricum borinquense]QIQ75818.1 XamI family restriction endonuclease [Halogeometricum borinquense]